MKAIIQTNYGTPDVLKIAEVDLPELKDNQVLVRVKASSINAGDVFALRGSPWPIRMTAGFPRPKNYIPGHDMSGVVEKVGTNGTRFQPGDEVYGSSGRAFAEFVAVDADKLALKPANLSFEQAATVPTGAIAALKGLVEVGKLRSNQKVLINGASGGVGTFAVQIAKALGAVVTGVCSTRNVELVRTLGADEVVDYTKKDFTQTDDRYDLILDNVASRSFSEMFRILTPSGLIVPNSGHNGMGYVFKALLLSPFIRHLGSPYFAVPFGKDLAQLGEWLESGKIRPVIDHCYQLSEIQEAFRYLDRDHARGRVVINMAE